MHDVYVDIYIYIYTLVVLFQTVCVVIACRCRTRAWLHTRMSSCDCASKMLRSCGHTVNRITSVVVLQSINSARSSQFNSARPLSIQFDQVNSIQLIQQLNSVNASSQFNQFNPPQPNQFNSANSGHFGVPWNAYHVSLDSLITTHKRHPAAQNSSLRQQRSHIWVCI